MATEYQWTDNPTVNGVSDCNTDVLNDCLMHLKYTKTIRNVGSTENSLIPLTDGDLHLYNGSLLSSDGSYGDFVDFMAAKYEDDEQTWEIKTGTPQQNLDASYYWQKILYANGQYYVYGQNFSVSGNNIYVTTSSDGINWSTPTQIFLNYYLNSNVVYAEDKFVMLCRLTGNNNLYSSYSTDGITWTTPTYIAEYSQSFTIAYGNGRFVALSYTGEKFTTSTDGITWTTPADKTSKMPYIEGLIYINEIFIAFSGSGYYQSSRLPQFGNDWSEPTKIEVLNTYPYWTEFVVDNNINKILAIGRTYTLDQGLRTYLSMSSDGINWSTAEIIDTTKGFNWQSLTYNYNQNHFMMLDTAYKYTNTAQFNYKGIFTSEVDWQESLNRTGQCGKFVYDNENNTLRLPKLDRKINDAFNSTLLDYVVVGTSIKPNLEVNLDKVATDLTNKADIDLKNVSNKSGFRKLTGIYRDGTSGYKVYSEFNPTTGAYIGLWCEQWGYCDTNYGTNTISLLKPYFTDDYAVYLTNKISGNSYASSVYSQSNDSFQIWVESADYNVFWKTEGYLN